MDDAFALLGLPRRAWLETDEVRAAFQRAAALSHPDRHGSADHFADVNRAYTVLRDPTARLRHFLELEHPAAASASEIPGDLMEWFPRVANALRRTRSTPTEAEATLAGLVTLRDASHTRIRQIEPNAMELSCMVPRLAYLDKWIAQLEEALLVLKM